MDDRLEDMNCDVRPDTFSQAMYENISNNGEISLYVSSTNVIRLLIVLRLINLKTMNG